MTSKCLVDGCDHPEELVRGRSAGGLCFGHRWRKKRGLPIEVPLRRRYRSRRGPLEAAALALADATEDREYQRGLDRLRKAAVRYAFSLPKRKK